MNPTLILLLGGFLAASSSASPARTVPLGGIALDGSAGSSGAGITIEATVDPELFAAREAPARAVLEQRFAIDGEGVLTESLRFRIEPLGEGAASFTIPFRNLPPGFTVEGEGLAEWSLHRESGNDRLEIRPSLAGQPLTITVARRGAVVAGESWEPILPGEGEVLLLRGRVFLDPSAEVLRLTIVNPEGLTGVASGPEGEAWAIEEGDYRFAVSAELSAAVPVVVRESGLSLQVVGDALSGTLQIRGEAFVPGEEILILAAPARLRGPGTDLPGELVRRDAGIFLRVDQVGPFRCTFPVAVPSLPGSGDPQVGFSFAEAPVRFLALAKDTEYPAEMTVDGRGAVEPGSTVFVPGRGDLHLGWRNRTGMKPESAVPPLFIADVTETARVTPGLLRQHWRVAIDVRQGELERLRLRLSGKGEIRSVSGAGDPAWEVVDGDAAGERLLALRFREPVAGELTITIHSESTLPPFPVDLGLMRFRIEEALRVSHRLDLETGGRVKARLAESPALRQIPTEGNQTTVSYRVADSTADLTLRVEDVVPVVFGDALILRRIGFVNEELEARFNIEVREAPVRTLRVTIPDGYLLSEVSAPGIADYRVAGEAGNRTLVIDLEQPRSDPFVVQLKLELPQSFAERATFLNPSLRLLDAAQFRGHYGLIVESGIAVEAIEAEGLNPVALAYFPAKAEGLRLGYRFRSDEWSLETRETLLPQTLVAELSHLYHLDEERIRGSSLMNLLVTGAPLDSLELVVPEGVENLSLESVRIESWEQDGSSVTVRFRRPVSGAFSLLASWEEPESDRNRLLPVGVAVPGATVERGYVFLLSEAPVSLLGTEVSGSFFPVSREEIPEDYRALFHSPLIAAFQYLEREGGVEVETASIPRATGLGQVVERAEASTLVTRHGGTRTVLELAVKSTRERFLDLSLPEGQELSRVEVRGQTVPPLVEGSVRRIPLPRDDQGSGLVPVTLELTGATPDGRTARIALPGLGSAVVRADWSLRSDEEGVLRVLDASGAPREGGAIEERRSPLWVVGGFWVALVVAVLAGRRMARLAVPGWQGRILRVVGLLLVTTPVVALLQAPDLAGVQGPEESATWSFPVQSLEAGATPWVEVAYRATDSIAWGQGIALAIFWVVVGYLVVAYWIPAFLRVLRGGVPVALLLLAGLLLLPGETGATIPAEEDDAAVAASTVRTAVSWDDEGVRIRHSGVWTAAAGDRLPLHGGGMVVASFAVERGALELVSGDAGLVLVASGGTDPVEHAWTLELVRVQSDRAPVAEFTLPAVASLVSEMEIAGLPDGYLVEVSGDRRRFAEGAVVHLPGTGSVVLKLVPDEGFAEPARSLTARSVHWVLPTLEGIESTGSYQFGWKSGRLERVSFAVPEGVAITGVKGDPVREWRITSGGRRLEVELEPFSARSLVLLISAFDAQSGGDVEGSLPVPLDCGLVDGTLGVATVETLSADEILAKGGTPLQQEDFRMPLPRGEPPLPGVLREAFRFSDLETVAVAATVRPVEPFVRLNENLEIAVTDERIRLSSRLALEITRAGIFEVRIAVPASLEIETVSGEGIDRWSTFTGGEGERELVIDFGRALRGGQNLLITASGDGAASLERWDLPRLRLVDADRYEGRLAINLEPGIRLAETTASGVSRGEDVSIQPLRDPGERIRYRLHQEDWSLAFRVEPQDPAVESVVAGVYRFGTGRLLVENRVRLEVTRAGLKEVVIEVPRDARSVRFGSRVAAQEITGEGPRRYRISFPEKVLGQTEFEVYYQTALSRDAAELALGSVWVQGARKQSGYLVVQSIPQLLVRQAATGTGFRVLRVDEVPEGILSANDLAEAHLILLAQDPDARLALNLERRRIEESVFDARINAVTLTSLVGSDGLLLNRARYEVVPNNQRMLQVRLPEGAAYWAAFVDGLAVEAWDQNGDPAGGAGPELSIPLGRRSGGKPIICEIYYRSRAEFRGDHLSLVAPQVRAAVQTVDWNLYLPESWEVDEDSAVGDLRFVQKRIRPVGTSGGVADFLQRFEAEERDNRKVALDMIAKGNRFRSQGNLNEAQQAFESAYNLSQNDTSVNSDALVQWQDLRQQSANAAIVNNLRQIASPQQQRAAEQQQEVVTGTGETDLLASRLIARDLDTLAAPKAIQPSLPEDGVWVNLARTLLDDQVRPATVSFEVHRGETRPDAGWFFALLPALLVVAILEAARRCSAGSRRC